MSYGTFFAESIDAVVFDVIGTLVDEDAALLRASQRIADVTGLGSPVELCRRWTSNLDDKMDDVVSGRSEWSPHQHLVTASGVDALVGLGATPTPEVMGAASSVDRSYQAWPDVADAIAALRRRGLVAGLSNGDLASLARLANINGISWDVALSTASVRTFKPAPAAYEYAIDAMELDPGRMLFAAAHPWDLRAAAEHGFRTAYIARPGAQGPSPDDRFDLVVPNLSELSELLP